MVATENSLRMAHNRSEDAYELKCEESGPEQHYAQGCLVLLVDIFSELTADSHLKLKLNTWTSYFVILTHQQQPIPETYTVKNFGMWSRPRCTAEVQAGLLASASCRLATSLASSTTVDMLQFEMVT